MLCENLPDHISVQQLNLFNCFMFDTNRCRNNGTGTGAANDIKQFVNLTSCCLLELLELHT